MPFRQVEDEGGHCKLSKKVRPLVIQQWRALGTRYCCSNDPTIETENRLNAEFLKSPTEWRMLHGSEC